MLFSYFTRFPKRSAAIRAKGGRPSKPRAPIPLRLEHLEERCTPAVHDLTSGGTFGSLQAAINAANPGDTILADAGTYAEQVTINKPLVLQGAQHGVDARTRTGTESIVTGTGNNGDTPFNVTANNVTIDGFTVQDATNMNMFGYGILEGAGTSGTQIVNNLIQDNIAGLALANASGGSVGLIQHNLFQNNNEAGASSGDAIYSDQLIAGGTLSNVTIDSNTFTGQSNAGLNFSSTDATKPATDITISNNVFDANAGGLLAFNLTSSTISNNTFSNSTSSAIADIRLFEGINGLNIAGNLLENGAGKAVHISNDGTGSPDATNIQFNLNSISGYTGSAGIFQVDNYTGTLNASSNWWGDISGPTVSTNSGGLGQTLVDPNNQVTYRTWLIYGTDADTIAAGFQLPTTINVNEGGDVSAADNDYTRLANAIGSVQSGQTIELKGTFDWTKPFASAAWALGNDGISGTGDDYTIYGPANVNNVTLTAASLGAATIQGPGSIPNLYQEGPLQLNTGNNGDRAYGSSTNQNWTISNLNIFDFALGIALFDNPGGNTSAFSGTHIVNNHIRLASDVLDTVAPANTIQNIGIYYSLGQNQVIQNNTIDLQGDGLSDSANGNFSAEVGMQGDTGSGNTYDGFLIDSNTVNVLHAQSGNPELIRGIWENTDGTTSNITVGNNKFLNLDASNNPALNHQIAFRLTSPSSATTTVVYAENQAAGANVGFQYYPGYDNTGTQPVHLVGNTLTNVFNGFDFANGAKTVNYLSGNSVSGMGSAGTGIAVGAGSTLTSDVGTGMNLVGGFATGVDVNGGTASLQQNTILGNDVGVSVENGGSLTSVTQNFINTNTSDGIQIASTAGKIGAITDNDLSGNVGKAVNNGLSTLVDASLNWWGSNTRAGVQSAIGGSVDYTPFLDSGLLMQPSLQGFLGDFSTLDVDIQSPEAGAVGRIQEGVNDALASGTVNVLAGTYVENVIIAKSLTLAGPSGNPPTAILHPAGGDGITIDVPNVQVTVENLEVTGADSGVIAEGLSETLTLQNLTLDGNGTGLTGTIVPSLVLIDLTLTGNTTAGGTLGDVFDLHYTPLSGSTGASSTITGSSFQRGSDQAINYSGVSMLTVNGSNGSDTFNVTPSPATGSEPIFNINGGLPNPRTTPGDTLILATAGTTNPTLSDTFGPSGFSGNYTFGNAHPVNFTGIETLSPTPPTITSSDTATFTVGQANTFQVTTTENSPSSTTLTETGALPGGVTFTASHNPFGSAMLTGIPNPGTGGTYSFTITASDGIAPDATQTFTLTVNEAPTITSGNAATFIVGQAGTFTVTTGHDFPMFTTLNETGTLPGGVIFINSPTDIFGGTETNNGFATFEGTPTTAGIYTFVITASNGVAPDATQTFTLIVQPATVQFATASESVSETAGTISLTVTLSAPLSVDTTIPFTLGGTAVAGTDYSGVTASPLVIRAGQTSGTITSTVLDDNLFDTTSTLLLRSHMPNRTLTLTLGTPTNAALGATTTNTLIILEDDDVPPTVQLGTETQNGNTFSIPVMLSAASEVATTIPFTLSGTAGVSGITVSPLVIPAGQTSGTITGTFIDGGLGGPGLTVSITLGTPTNATVTGTNPATFSEGNSTANIQGTVFFDYNTNGTLDAGDTGLGGRTVFLDLQNDGTLDAGDPTAVTDANGNYVFTAVNAGSYTVRELVGFANVIQTGPVGSAFHVTLAGTAANGLNFGNFLNQAIAPVQLNADRFGTGSNPDADTAYIRGLYFALLGRDANRQLVQSDGTSISEVQYWLNQMNNGMTRVQVAQEIVDSPEHRGLEVDAYYQTYLKRGETAEEQAFWLNRFEMGADEATVVEGFLNSTEYQLAHPSDSSFVQDLYVNVLGRFGSDAEMTAAEMVLANGLSRDALGQMFVHSAEADQLAVTSFYGSYLHRAPDAGTAFWESQLSSGQSLGSVQAGILGDPTVTEFFNDGAATVK